jgi:hypothetical protein
VRCGARSTNGHPRAFLRNPNDPRDWNADSRESKMHTQDRFALKFVKR